MDSNYLFSLSICLCLSSLNIILAIKDILYYRLRSLYSGMVLAFVFVHAYGVLFLPFKQFDAIHDKKFNLEILTKEIIGLIIINLVLLAIYGLRRILMKEVDPSTLIRKWNPVWRDFLFLPCIVGTIAYSLLFVALKRSRLGDLFSVIKSADFSEYYLVRKDLIFEKAYTNRIITNLDSILVYSMLYFLLGMLAYLAFSKLRWNKIIAISIGSLTILTALLRFQRAPLAVAVLVVMLAYLFSRDYESKKSIKLLLKSGFVGVLALASFGIINSILGFEGSIVNAIYERILITPAFTSYGFYWTFPDHHGFLHYGGSRTFNTVFGFMQPVSWSTEFITAPLIASYYFYGAVFNFNTSILGDGYANNGYLGVVQATVVLFGTFAFWDYIFGKKLKYIPYEPVLIYCFAHVIIVLNVGMLTIFGSGFLLIPAAYILIVQNRFRPPFHRVHAINH